MIVDLCLRARVHVSRCDAYIYVDNLYAIMARLVVFVNAYTIHPYTHIVIHAHTNTHTHTHIVTRAVCHTQTHPHTYIPTRKHIHIVI